MTRNTSDAIDAAAGVESDKPARPEMLRRIVKDWLIGHGYLKDQAMRKFIQATSEFSSEVRRIAVVANIERFETVHPTGWREVEPDFREESAVDEFERVLAKARENGFEIIEKQSNK